MQTMIDLLVLLQRHEHTAAVASEQMSPRELGTLQMQLELVRDTIHKYVLGHYERLKQSEPALEECPAALAMATLVSVYRALPRQKRQSLGSFFDLAGYGVNRNVHRLKECGSRRMRPRTAHCSSHRRAKVR